MVGNVKFDQEPTFSNGTYLKDRVRKELGIELKLGGRHHHGDVGAAEALNNVLTRTAEVDIARAGRTAAFLMNARLYALHRLNRRPVGGGGGASRLQRYTGTPVDLSQTTPYLWGCEVVITNSHQVARACRGALGRSSDGVLIGIEGQNYLVRKTNGNIARPKHVRPLNEHAMLAAGIPANVAATDNATQTPTGGVLPLGCHSYDTKCSNAIEYGETTTTACEIGASVIASPTIDNGVGMRTRRD